MKNRLMILLITACVSLSSNAATCPPLSGLDLENPPLGWTLLIPPQLEDQTYHFGKAIYSQNGSFFYGQVLCTYETCSSLGCPMFVLLSDDTYTSPTNNASPWNAPQMVAQTLVCAPTDHDPSKCVFE